MAEEQVRPVFEIAWTEVEGGWRVVASDGTSVGKVKRAVGDADLDIFEGFEIDVGLLNADRFVSWEHVTAVSPGVVQLDLTRDQVKELPPS